MTSSPLIRHGACGRGWTGITNGHCSGCHETFGRGAFDLHQRMRYGQSVCLTPTEAGLVGRTKPWGTLWVTDGGPGYWNDINAHHPRENQ